VSGTDQYHAALLREEANAGRAINPNKRLGAAVAARSTSDTPATAPPLASATYRTVIEPQKQRGIGCARPLRILHAVAWLRLHVMQAREPERHLPVGSMGGMMEGAGSSRNPPPATSRLSAAKERIPFASQPGSLSCLDFVPLLSPIKKGPL
jgi:hypothetical protein